MSGSLGWESYTSGSLEAFAVTGKSKYAPCAQQMSVVIRLVIGCFCFVRVFHLGAAKHPELLVWLLFSLMKLTGEVSKTMVVWMRNVPIGSDF